MTRQMDTLDQGNNPQNGNANYQHDSQRWIIPIRLLQKMTICQAPSTNCYTDVSIT